MFIQYEEGDLVKLRRTNEHDDLDDWGMTQDELDALRLAEDDELECEIICEDCQGYYSIRVYQDGMPTVEFDAISVYHLYPATENILGELDLRRFDC